MGGVILAKSTGTEGVRELEYVMICCMEFAAVEGLISCIEFTGEIRGTMFEGAVVDGLINCMEFTGEMRGTMLEGAVVDELNNTVL